MPCARTPRRGACGASSVDLEDDAVVKDPGRVAGGRPRTACSTRSPSRTISSPGAGPRVTTRITIVPSLVRSRPGIGRVHRRRRRHAAGPRGAARANAAAAPGPRRTAPARRSSAARCSSTKPVWTSPAAERRMLEHLDQERDVGADAEDRERAERGDGASDRRGRASRRTRSAWRASDRTGPAPRSLLRRRCRRGCPGPDGSR